MKSRFIPPSLLVFFTSLLILAGCAGQISNAKYVSTETRLISGIPFYDDTGNQCGPASLAAVINYWHNKSAAIKQVTPDRISSDVYSKTAGGTLGMDLEFYAARNGFITKQYMGNIDELKENIIKGIPPVILVDYGIFIYQRNHFMVVTGYGGNGIIVHSGRDEKIISYEKLEKIWRKTGFWTLVIKPAQ